MATNNENGKYAYLDRLSTEQLEELMRADIESSDVSNHEAIFHILEVIERREQAYPNGRFPDEDKSWEEFQIYYNIPGEEGIILYPTGGEDKPEKEAREEIRNTKVIRLRPVFKVASIVAAIVFGMIITAQAAGVDVFGAIGRWTEETFHFVTSPSGVAQTDADGISNLLNYSALQTALDSCGITQNLAPTWYPEGTTAKEPKILNDDFSDTVSIYYDIGDEKFFSVSVTNYRSASAVDSFVLEKDDTPVDKYISGTKTFYILSNIDTITATWCDGLLLESISGNLSTEEIKAIIDSIGGQ